ncbi:hypothetical protein ACE5IS_02705 [Leptospira wolffii]|uniref:Uncharacterized protein n=1 Tax=Leptospira wolffii TaxID=409998 RepID=A0ABV5BL20_9LEPT|nr:hypothetical protein [Leptospira wolffii]TGL49466.1 hypothetical protein EHQ61_13555 [Leptospira wolffii]
MKKIRGIILAFAITSLLAGLLELGDMLYLLFFKDRDIWMKSGGLYLGAAFLLIGSLFLFSFPKKENSRFGWTGMGFAHAIFGILRFLAILVAYYHFINYELPPGN